MDAYIEQAARLLRDNKVGGMPVVDDNGKLVGIITKSDIFDAFLDTLGVNCKGARISLRAGEEPEELAQLIGENDSFGFTCKQCGTCCMNRSDIILNPYDIYRVLKWYIA